jgi:hypothetical protein
MNDDPFNAFIGLDHFIEIPDAFESEIAVLVLRNHEFTLKGIEAFENEGTQEIASDFEGNEPEIISSEISHFSYYCDDLRKAATRQALVGLVTRLEHWARTYERQMLKRLPSALPSKDVKDKSRLWSRLEALNAGIGKGPIEIDYFDELATVRNSIIHGDSQAEWADDRSGKRRIIPDRYWSSYEDVDFTDSDLHEAIDKAKQQMSFYEKSIYKLPLPNRESKTP